MSEFKADEFRKLLKGMQVQEHKHAGILAAVESAIESHALRSQAIVSELCDRLDQINSICHDESRAHSDCLAEITDLSAGYAPIPTDPI